ncbi:hypothetical protein F5146DRAFT_1001762 [Armillaria mellea]|nr:hypothetical protein F5146DRAFT_1001762 [Armillaria mellea]
MANTEFKFPLILNPELPFCMDHAELAYEYKVATGDMTIVEVPKLDISKITSIEHPALHTVYPDLPTSLHPDEVSKYPNKTVAEIKVVLYTFDFWGRGPNQEDSDIIARANKFIPQYGATMFWQPIMDHAEEAGMLGARFHLRRTGPRTSHIVIHPEGAWTRWTLQKMRQCWNGKRPLDELSDKMKLLIGITPKQAPVGLGFKPGKDLSPIARNSVVVNNFHARS